MEPFEIEITGTHYLIKPTYQDRFQVYENENLIGELETIANDDLSTGWVTADLMGKDFAQQIGEFIEEHEM